MAEITWISNEYELGDFIRKIGYIISTKVLEGRQRLYCDINLII